MAKRRSGIPSLAYMGVNASSPPNKIIRKRAPTPNDWENFIIGDKWQVENEALPDGDKWQIWTLVSLSQQGQDGRALWVREEAIGQFTPDIAILTDPPTGTAITNASEQMTVTSTQNLTAIAAGSAFEYDLNDDVVINSSLEVTALGGAVTKLLTINTSGRLVTTEPTADGQVPIGKGSDGSFLWKTITAGSGITIANGPNSITIDASGGGGIDTIHNDSATDVVEDIPNDSVNIYGGNILETLADPGDPGNHTLIVRMTETGTDGQIPIAATGGSPAWASITGAGGIAINVGANTIQIDGSGITPTLTATLDDATTAVSAAGAMNVLGGTGISGYSTNIHTYADPNGGTNLYVGLNDSINWPDTNVSGTGNDTGVLQIQGTRFLHNYGTDNTWVGKGAGRRNAGLTGSSNTGIGRQVGDALTSGSQNTLFGYQAGTSITEGTHNTALGASSLATLVGNIGSGYGRYNVAIGAESLNALSNGAGAITAGSNTAGGYQSLNNLVSGEFNTVFGQASGSAYTGSESSNILFNSAGVIADNNTIRIGTHGNTGNQQSATYIAGIQDVPPLSQDLNVVFIQNDHQLTNLPGQFAGQIMYSGATAAAGGGVSWGFITSTDLSVTSAPGPTINDRRQGFFAYGGGSESAETGDGTIFWLGTGSGSTAVKNFTVPFNGGSDWSHPSGSYGRYKAPFTGMYFMQCTIYLTNIPPGGPTPAIPGVAPGEVYIDVNGATATSDAFRMIQRIFGGTSNSQSISLSAFIKLTSGDTVRFGVMFDHGALDIYPANTSALTMDPGIQWCSGRLVYRL